MFECEANQTTLTIVVCYFCLYCYCIHCFPQKRFRERLREPSTAQLWNSKSHHCRLCTVTSLIVGVLLGALLHYLINRAQSKPHTPPHDPLPQVVKKSRHLHYQTEEG